MKARSEFFRNLSATICLTFASATAAPLYWDSNGTTAGAGTTAGTWSTSGGSSFWSTDDTGTTAPGAWVDGSDVNFASGANSNVILGTVTVSGTVLTNNITFGDNASLTISGGTIGFGGTIGTINSAAVGTANSRQIVLGSALTGTSGLTIAAHGDLSDNGGGNTAFLQLAGTNSGLSGGITITSGLVDLLAAGAAGSNAITLNGGGLLNAGHGTITLANDISVGASGGYFRVYGSNTSALTGTLSGSGQFAKTDGGTLNLSGTANTFTGALRVGGGTLALTGAGVVNNTGNYAGNITTISGSTLSYGSSATQTFSGTVSNAGTLGVSAGTLNLTGAVSGAGATTVSGGTLNLDYTASNTTKLGTGMLTFGGGTLKLTGNAAADTSQTSAGGLTINTGVNTLTLATQAGRTLTFDASGSALTLKGGLDVTTTGTGTAAVKLPGTTANSVVGWATYNGTFAKTNASNVLTAGSTNSAVTALGSWTTGSTQYTTTGSAFTGSVGAGVTIDGITFSDIAARTVAIGTGNTLTLNQGVIVNSAVGANASTISGGSIRGSASGTLNLLNNNTSGSLTITSTIANNGGATGLAKYGAGTVIVNVDANSFTGPVTVNSGELQALVTTSAGSKTPLGTGAITVNSGSTLRFKTGSTGNAMSFVNAINLNGSTFINEDGVQTISGNLITTGSSTVNGVWGGKNLTFSGNTTVASGTLTVTGSANETFSNLNIASGANFSAQANTLVGVVSGAGSLQLNSNSASLTITGDNSSSNYTGNISLGAPSAAGGSFTVNAGAKLVTTGTFIETWSKTNTINGTLSTGGFTLSTANNTTLGGTGTVNVSGYTNQNSTNATISVANFNVGSSGMIRTNGTITFGATTVGALANWSSSAPLGLTAATNTTFNTSGGSITLSGAVGNSTTGALTKSGAGILTLSGNNTYTGLTTINTGTLRVTGTNTSAITVNSGAILNGASTGTTTGLLTMNAGSFLAADTTGAFTSNGVNFVGATSLIFTTAPTSGSTYDVLKYGVTGATNPGSFTTGTRGALNQDTVNNKFTFTAGAVGTRTWNTTSGNWDNMATASFSESDQKFSTGDTVVFNDPASASTVTLVGNLYPVSVSVNNSNNYTFSGSGGIAGSSTLTKAGAGTLTLSTTNAFTGNTTISAGTLEIGASGVLGGGSTGSTYAGTISNSGILKINTTANQTLSGVISGTGSLLKDNTGVLTLSATNTFSNGTTVAAGTLKLATGGSSGAIRGTITVNTGATLDLAFGDATGYSTGTDSLKTINLNGGNLYISTTSNQTLGSATVNLTGGTISGVSGSNLDFFGGASALNTLASATTSTISGTNITLRQTGGATFTVATGTTASGIDLDIQSVVTNGGYGAQAFTKAGTGTLRLSGTNNYTGATNITGGTLELGGSGQLGSGTYSGAVSNTGILKINTTASQTLSGVISGAGSLVKNNTGTLTLSGANTFSGGSTVNAGILVANGPNGTTGTLGGGNVTVNSGATIQLGTADNALVGTGTSAAKTITINQGGLVTNPGGTTNHLNALVLNGGTLSATTANTTYGNWNFDYGVSTGGLGTTSSISGGNAALTQSGGTSFNVGTGDTLNVTTTLANVSGAGDTGLTKSGAGILAISNAGNTFTSNVNITGGTLRTGTDQGGGTNGHLGVVSGSRTISIGTGATLDVRGNNLFGGGGKTAATIPSIIINGGTYSATRFNIVGNLTLSNGAQLVTSATDSGNYEGFEFIGGTITVSGTSASTISSTNGKANHLAGGRTTTFNVSDVTASSAADLTISNTLRDGSGDYTGVGALTKTGNGTLTFTGSNTYSGLTTVNAGTLRVNGANSGAGSFTVASGATLGGTGNITGTVSVSGVLSPGASIESLATGSLSMSGGSSLEYELQDASGSGADLLDITGDLNLAGLVTLDLQKIGTGTWSISDKLTLLSYTGAWNGGLFTYAGNTVADDTNFTFDGQLWTLNYDDSTAGSNFSSEATGTFVTMTAIPEPRAALIGGLGLLALFRRRRAS